VTVPLACRLLESKLLLRSEVAQALRESCSRGIAFVQALMERTPNAGSLLDAEFSRWSGPAYSGTTLAVDHALVLRLPLGMCERFLALPLIRSGPSVPVPLAVVDPFDTHVLAEFRYCLGLAVTPVRARFSMLVYALETVQRTGTTGGTTTAPLLDVADADDTPAFGTKILGATRRLRRTMDFGDGQSPVSRQSFTLPPLESGSEPSEPPLPLVRTTMAPGPAVFASIAPNPVPVFRDPSQPGVGREGNFAQSAEPTASVLSGQGRGARDSEPVLKLVKQKPVTLRISVPPPPRNPEGRSEAPERVLEDLVEARNPRQLIERLQTALRGTAPCQAYFSVRSDKFVLEWVKATTQEGKLELTNEQNNLLRTACQAGYFLGPLPPDGSRPALGSALGMRSHEEVYAAPVNVANRAALVIVVGRFDEAFAVTRWVDAVVTRAGQVLEQLARTKKNR